MSKLEEGQTFWYLYFAGSRFLIGDLEWYDSNPELAYFKSGNFFLTEAEAKATANQLNTIFENQKEVLHANLTERK